MIKNKGTLSLVGFVLAGLGFLSIILSLVGVQFVFLTWLDNLGSLTGFLAKIAMIIVGILIIYFAQSDFEGVEGDGRY